MIDKANADLLLTTTRAVRKRLDLGRPVPVPLIEECIDVALQAPNGGNQQLWRWVIVTDQEKRTAIAEIYRRRWEAYLPRADAMYDPADPRREAEPEIRTSAQYLADHFHEVPALVIPYYEAKLDGAWYEWVRMAHASTFPATWSFMLAARARGLGTSMTTLVRTAELNEVIGAPDDCTHCAVIPVAYHRGDSFQPGSRLSAAQVTFHDSWGHRTT